MNSAGRRSAQISHWMHVCVKACMCACVPRLVCPENETKLTVCSMMDYTVCAKHLISKGTVGYVSLECYKTNHLQMICTFLCPSIYIDMKRNIVTMGTMKRRCWGFFEGWIWPTSVLKCGFLGQCIGDFQREVTVVCWWCIQYVCTRLSKTKELKI